MRGASAPSPLSAIYNCSVLPKLVPPKWFPRIDFGRNSVAKTGLPGLNLAAAKIGPVLAAKSSSPDFPIANTEWCPIQMNCQPCSRQSISQPFNFASFACKSI